MTPEELYKQTVLQQIFDIASDLMSLANITENEINSYSADSLKKEFAYLLWELQRESSHSGAVDPLTRSTNYYGKQSWITEEQINKI